jgi:hypothetical protein
LSLDFPVNSSIALYFGIKSNCTAIQHLSRNAPPNGPGASPASLLPHRTIKIWVLNISGFTREYLCVWQLTNANIEKQKKYPDFETAPIRMRWPIVRDGRWNVARGQAPPVVVNRYRPTAAQSNLRENL